MMWDNDTLRNMILDRSSDIGADLLPKRPEKPENNQLIIDRVSKKQILLRKQLDEIQGNDSNDQLTGVIASTIEMVSDRKPIEKNKYSESEIEQFFEYQKQKEEWEEMKNLFYENRLPYTDIFVPQMALVYTRQKDDFALCLISQDGYFTEVNLEESVNIIGSSNLVSDYNTLRKATIEDIDKYIEGVNFESLRKRILNAGYDKVVEDINRDLPFFQ